MGFSEAIVAGFSNYFNFSGRASRSEYWWFQLFFVLCMTVSMGIAGAAQSSAFFSALLGFVSILGYLAFLIPSISIGVRRLHDRNMSGWWYLLFMVPVGSLILLIIFVMKGTEGANRFGPDPLQSPGQQKSFSVQETEEEILYSRSSIPRVDRE